MLRLSAAAVSAEDINGMVFTLEGASGSALVNRLRESKRTHVWKRTENGNRGILINFRLYTRTLLHGAVLGLDVARIHENAAFSKPTYHGAGTKRAVRATEFEQATGVRNKMKSMS